ncbi:MAG: AAA family ATPase [Candidatus Pacebacteria bacterium]|nr:AAA family ATPase [Candidatus Paceibacterota bacterium]
MNKNIEKFYIEWKSNLDQYLKSYFQTPEGKKRKTRSSYLMLQKYVNKLISGELPEEEKIIILPGIRGVGKTTLLSQLYFFEINKPVNHLSKDINTTVDERIYISVDRLLSEDISLGEFIDYLEKNVWGNLLQNKKKILLLIDEIQYDPKWDLFLKLLFDKTKGNKNILVIATGSSAIFLNQKNKDLVRRSKTERVLPTKFCEYLTLHKDIFPEKDLSKNLARAIFHSKNAQEVFDKIKQLQSVIIKKLSTITNLNDLKKDYFYRGSFPFSAEMINESEALERIKAMILINIVQRDLILLNDFNAETLVKIPNVLFLLANSDEISIKKLSETIDLAPLTLNKILSALTDAEILYELKAYGQPYKQVKKSGKYLFMSPNIRIGLLSGVIGVDIKGKILEDYLALLFSKELYGQVDAYYDYGSGGADFIVRFKDNTEIVFEIGFSKNEINQVQTTMKKTKGRAKYGIVFGSDSLELSEDSIVKIPLDYLLLL